MTTVNEVLKGWKIKTLLFLGWVLIVSLGFNGYIGFKKHADKLKAEGKNRLLDEMALAIQQYGKVSITLILADGTSKNLDLVALEHK